MFFFVFKLLPHPTDVSDTTVSPAHASCWVNEISEPAAEARGRRLIARFGRDVIETLEANPIRAQDYVDGANGLRYYRQALIDGEV